MDIKKNYLSSNFWDGSSFNASSHPSFSERLHSTLKVHCHRSNHAKFGGKHKKKCLRVYAFPITTTTWLCVWQAAARVPLIQRFERYWARESAELESPESRRKRRWWQRTAPEFAPPPKSSRVAGLLPNRNFETLFSFRKWGSTK